MQIKHLPSAPNEAERHLYVKSNRGPLYALAVASTVLVTVGGLGFSLHRPDFIWFAAFVLVTAVYLAVSYAIGIAARPFCLDTHECTLAAAGMVSYRPTVDVFLPSAGEPLEVLRNTFKHVAKLVWHGGDRLMVYVLDDSARDAVRELAAEFRFQYLVRPDRGVLKKAGNIRYGFARSSGELIAIFDADFAPSPDFLLEMTPYFMQNDIGIVQSPQWFQIDPSQPAIQRGAAAVQELFYRLIQVSRNSWGASICVGTNAVYRRSALEPFGGTYPIEHSEDVHTGFNLLRAGWRVVYVPIVLAAGLCPDSLASFLTQQYRWCSGSTTLLMNRDLFWGTKLSVMQRLCFLSGMFYYSVTALSVIVTPIPGILMVWFEPNHVYWWNIAFSLPSFVLGTIFMAFWNRSPYGLSAVMARHASYWAHLFALKDKLLGGVMPWVPTGDGKAARSSRTVRAIRASILWWTVGTTLLGWAGAARAMDSWADFNFWPFLALSAFNGWLHLWCLWSDDDREDDLGR